MSKHERGTFAKAPGWHAEDASAIVVLSGPMNVYGNYYTCLVLEDGLLDTSPYGGRLHQLRVGRTLLVPENFITANRSDHLWSERLISLAQKRIRETGSAGHTHSDVIEKWCPNCEIDDMIFYSEDYICAWCREMLEE